MRHDRGERVYIYGKHALMEALANAPHVVRKVFLSSEAANDRELRHLLTKAKVPVTFMKGKKEASRMVGDETSHQGVIALADTSSLVEDFANFLVRLQTSDDTMLVLLDELTDPHNVGAIIRSAAAFGAAGVLMPTHNQAPITGAVVKTSAGMVFRVPIVSIGNANYAIDTLKEKGFRTYALAMDGKGSTGKESFEGPTLIVIGNEAKGIRQKTLERADITLRIPMHPRTESLNASVSAAIVLYEWSTAHPKALRGS
jgi:23S rRNA (guanosine2251-2'-O)-methyltransferase